jgi:hypothetical protein
MPDGFIKMDKIAENATAANEPPGKKAPREQGGIEFPYVSLDSAISVARALLEAGAVPVERDQLAARMGHSLSGSFVNKTSAAKMFGLIEFSSGKYRLTQLGHAILDTNRSAATRAEAFLLTPLYRRIYDEFRNNQLPPSPHGIEQAMVDFGVPQKQKDRARRAFESSARQAGFFAHGKDRLVAPVVSGTPSPTPEVEETHTKPKVEEQQRGSLPAPAEHPFIKGLLMSLPEKLQENWTAPERVKWLKAAADAFELMFKGGTPITITATDSTRRSPRKPTDEKPGT